MLTAFTVAVNEAVVDPAFTVSEAGIETALLLLARATVRAFDAAAFRETVHAVFPAPAKEVLAHERALSTGADAGAVCTGEREMDTDFATLPCVAVMIAV